MQARRVRAIGADAAATHIIRCVGSRYRIHAHAGSGR